MRETTRIIRLCGQDNPRSAAINKAVEESGLGFPEHCKDYPSLIGKTVVVMWASKTKHDNIYQRGEVAAIIVGLRVSDDTCGHINVTLALKCMDSRFRLFYYDENKKRWTLESSMDALAPNGVSVQINLA